MWNFEPRTSQTQGRRGIHSFAMPDEIQYGNGDTYTATFALTVLLDKIYTRDDSSKF
jgi:hypothetical protein